MKKLMFVLALALILPFSAAAEEAEKTVVEEAQAVVAADVEAIVAVEADVTSCGYQTELTFPLTTGFEADPYATGWDCSQTTPCNSVSDCPCNAPDCACVNSPNCGQICLCLLYCWGPPI